MQDILFLYYLLVSKKPGKALMQDSFFVIYSIF